MDVGNLWARVREYLCSGGVCRCVSMLRSGGDLMNTRVNKSGECTIFIDDRRRSSLRTIYSANVRTHLET